MSPKIWLFLVLLAPASARADVVASWYGGRVHEGHPTASGCAFRAAELTAASRTLALGTLLRVTRGDRVVTVVINDRGPYVRGRSLDLSRAAAERLGMREVGVSRVQVEVVGSTTLRCRRRA